MKIHQLFPLIGTNTSRQRNFDGIEDELDVVKKLVDKGGWQGSLGTCGVAKADPELLAKGVMEYLKTLEDRAAELYKVKVNVKIGQDYVGKDVEFTGADVLRQAKARFLNPKTGKPVTVDRRVVFGHRRASKLDMANAVFERLQLPLITEIEVTDLSGLSEAELHERNIRENLDRTAAKALGPVDNYRAAKLLFEEGANQSTIRHIFGDGNGQKFFKLLTVVAADKAGALDPKQVEAAQTAGVILGTLHDEIMAGKVDLAALGQGGKDAAAKKAADALAAKEITLAEAVTMIRKPEAKANKPKAVKMEDQIALAKQSPVMLVRYVVTNLVNGTKEGIVKLNEKQGILNEAWVKLGLDVPEVRS